MLEWHGRNLINFVNTNGEIYNYSYNADGIRTRKTVYDANGDYVGTTEYIYDGTKLIAESRSGTWLYYFYDANGAIIGVSYNGTVYYFRKNLQGDITGIYNASGNIIVQYEYTPYGAIFAITDANGNDVSTNATHIANINPFRYRGYYYDTETGFYYLQTRYYDPVVGRFLNADAFVSTGQGILGNNMFAYCNNNPLLYTDISGCWPSTSSSGSDNGGGNAGINCYVYEYEYTTGFWWWKKTHVGRVYIYKNVSKDQIADLANSIYGFNSGTDVIVGDFTNSKNPNMYVYRADRVKSKYRKFIIDCLLQYDTDHGTNWNRTRSSLLTEWREHDRYSFASERARNIDFDNAEEGEGFFYFAWKAIKAAFD